MHSFPQNVLMDHMNHFDQICNKSKQNYVQILWCMMQMDESQPHPILNQCKWNKLYFKQGLLLNHNDVGIWLIIGSGDWLTLISIQAIIWINREISVTFESHHPNFHS